MKIVSVEVKQVFESVMIDITTFGSPSRLGQMAWKPSYTMLVGICSSNGSPLWQLEPATWYTVEFDQATSERQDAITLLSLYSRTEEDISLEGLQALLECVRTGLPLSTVDDDEDED